MSDSPAAKPEKLSFGQQMASFPAAFWVANIIELVERFSFYGVRTIAALYIVLEAEKGGLEFSNADRGLFFGVWSLIQCFLPMFTGGFSDRYGYRISLMLAFGINIVGYGLVGYVTSWWGFMLACCLIGTGTAIFKPPLHGTIAHCVNESNSSLGWGTFYQVVNIGGFIGPMVLGFLRREFTWSHAFFTASGIIILNVLIAGLFLKDYSKEGNQDEAAKSKGPFQVFWEAVTTLRDIRFTLFLAIFSGFYFMFMQLFDQLAVFIEQWINTNDIATSLARITGLEYFQNMAANNGQMPPEWVIQVDAGSIVILVLLVSYIAGRFRPISAMIVGMFIACFGLVAAGSVTTGWMCVLAIFVFSVGEMACGPKFSEYIGLMAPPEKKALYMGYSNIPFAVGWGGANFIGGPLYDRLSDKFELARDYLVTQLGQDATAVEALTKTEVMTTLTEALGQSESAVQRLLWDHYHPQSFWVICMGIGLLSTLAMVGYHFWLLGEAKKREAAAAG